MHSTEKEPRSTKSPLNNWLLSREISSISQYKELKWIPYDNLDFSIFQIFKHGQWFIYIDNQLLWIVKYVDNEMKLIKLKRKWFKRSKYVVTKYQDF